MKFRSHVLHSLLEGFVQRYVLRCKSLKSLVFNHICIILEGLHDINEIIDRSNNSVMVHDDCTKM